MYLVKLLKLTQEDKGIDKRRNFLYLVQNRKAFPPITGKYDTQLHLQFSRGYFWSNCIFKSNATKNVRIGDPSLCPSQRSIIRSIIRSILPTTHTHKKAMREPWSHATQENFKKKKKIETSCPQREERQSHFACIIPFTKPALPSAKRELPS